MGVQLIQMTGYRQIFCYSLSDRRDIYSRVPKRCVVYLLLWSIFLEIISVMK